MMTAFWIAAVFAAYAAGVALALAATKKERATGVRFLAACGAPDKAEETLQYMEAENAELAARAFGAFQRRRVDVHA